MLADTPVDVVVPIEDAESTALLDFPQAGGSASDQDIEALKAAITSMQAELANMGGQPAPAGRVSGGAAYDFAILGVSLAAVVVVLGVVALVKRPRVAAS